MANSREAVLLQSLSRFTTLCGLLPSRHLWQHRADIQETGLIWPTSGVRRETRFLLAILFSRFIVVFECLGFEGGKGGISTASAITIASA
ncbi:MAG: hypothetical protein M3436_04515, partial [Pseudomonadota bacterium]|nr:hypothetical protein [Pseudomonadota bacterium]